MDFSKCYQGGVKNPSVCSGGGEEVIKGEGSVGPYFALMRQEEQDLDPEARNTYSSTDIIWKARADLRPAQDRCCHGNLSSLRDKLWKNLPIKYDKNKRCQSFPWSNFVCFSF